MPSRSVGADAAVLAMRSSCAHINAHIEVRTIETNSRKIIRMLERIGFELVKVVGSHHKFRKSGKTVTVPHPKKDLPRGTVRGIYRQAGWL